MTTSTIDARNTPSEKLTQIVEQLDTFERMYETILHSADINERYELLAKLSREKMAIIDSMLDLRDEDVQFPRDYDAIHRLIKFYSKNCGRAELWEDHKKIEQASFHLSDLIRRINQISPYSEKHSSGLNVTPEGIHLTTSVGNEGGKTVVKTIELTRDGAKKALEISW